MRPATAPCGPIMNRRVTSWTRRKHRYSTTTIARTRTVFVHGFDLLLDGHAQAAFFETARGCAAPRRLRLPRPSRIPVRPALIEAAVAVGEVPIARLMCADLDQRVASTVQQIEPGGDPAQPGGDSVADGMDDADSMLAASAQQFEDIGVPLEAARSYHLLGSRRRRLGHRTAAREALMRAHEITLGCGANRLAVTIDLEMRRLGGRTTGSRPHRCRSAGRAIGCRRHAEPGRCRSAPLHREDRRSPPEPDLQQARRAGTCRACQSDQR